MRNGLLTKPLIITHKLLTTKGENSNLMVEKPDKHYLDRVSKLMATITEAHNTTHP
jgi:hypothetical protein